MIVAMTAIIGGVVAAACGSSSTPVKTPVAGMSSPMAGMSSPVAGMNTPMTGSETMTADQTVTIDAKNVKFVPNAITVPAGKTIKLVLVNSDKGTPHDLTSDDLVLASASGGGHGGTMPSGDAMKLVVHTNEGETSSATFMADKPGTYNIYCTIPGHKDAGMIGTITVV